MDQKEERGLRWVDARAVDRARLENEKSQRLVGSNPTLPGYLGRTQGVWKKETLSKQRGGGRVVKCDRL
jgi:hypothetical protein